MPIFISDVRVTKNVASVVPGDNSLPRVLTPESNVWVGDEFVTPGSGVEIYRGRNHVLTPGEWWVTSNKDTEYDLRIPTPEGDLEAYVRYVAPNVSLPIQPSEPEFVPPDKTFYVYFELGNGTDWPAFVRPNWALFTILDSHKHVNAPSPLALMQEGDAWRPHPQASIYTTMYGG